MKMVVAYIKPRMFAAVTLALQDIEGLTGASVGDVRGFGRGRAKNAPDRRQRDLVDYMPRIRIEVACADALATEVVETVERAAHSGAASALDRTMSQRHRARRNLAFISLLKRLCARRHHQTEETFAAGLASAGLIAAACVWDLALRFPCSRVHRC